MGTLLRFVLLVPINDPAGGENLRYGFLLER